MNTEDPKSKELSLEKRREIIKTIKQELKKNKKTGGWIQKHDSTKCQVM